MIRIQFLISVLYLSLSAVVCLVVGAVAVAVAAAYAAEQLVV